MSRTALLVIDIQRGAFDGVRCPPLASPERLVRHAGRLLQAAREGGHHVVFVRHCDEPGAAFEDGTPHGELHESLVPAAADIVLKKQQSSAFDGTDLQKQLQDREVAGLVLCGLQSEFCVSNTARSALALGYRVQVASDGHGTWPSDGRSADEISAEVNRQLAEAGAELAGTDVLAARLVEPR
ncbi:cysteine hydrolase family protein [Ideonella sp. YS5]|uniref:cysteine hydrolase family protein n=1 Tax=Ideonella sp. YS5 TaxID=3453714 RepID=UPI003EEB9626